MMIKIENMSVGLRKENRLKREMKVLGEMDFVNF